MTFNTLQFIPFALIIFIVHYTVPWQPNKIFLVIASLLFYTSFDPPFVLLLIAQTVIDFWVGNLLHRAEEPRRRKLLLVVSLTVNLGMLGYFKYSDFLIGAMADGLAWFGISLKYPGLGLVLPVGISFYTFHTLSYTIDIYRRKITPAPFIDFLLFVTYFTQLVAGPIVRAAHMLPQLKRRRYPSWHMISLGAWMVILGYTKKIVFADNLADFTGPIFNNPGGFTDFDRFMANLGFEVQIYCDFSGYSDIAIGLCLLMGIHVRRNFRIPYLAIGIADFWRRWHISLSSWIRDYLYIPLGGSRTGLIRHTFNLLFTMTVCGLWHGASWMYVGWGFLHGALLVGEMYLRNAWHWGRERLAAAGATGAAGTLQLLEGSPLFAAGLTLLTLTVITLTWPFFRCHSMADAMLFMQSWYNLTIARTSSFEFASKWKVEACYIFLFFGVHALVFLRRHAFVRLHVPWPAHALLAVTMLFLVANSWASTNVFIYFQF